MVNFGSVLQYLSLQSPQQMLSGDQYNTTATAAMAATTYALPTLPYAYNVSLPRHLVPVASTQKAFVLTAGRTRP